MQGGENTDRYFFSYLMHLPHLHRANSLYLEWNVKWKKSNVTLSYLKKMDIVPNNKNYRYLFNTIIK